MCGLFGYIYKFSNNLCDEITITFLSDIEDFSYLHYKKQPRSMLCRKVEKFFIEGEWATEDLEDFQYNWLPNCVKIFQI